MLVEGDVLYLARVNTEELLAVNLTPGSRAPATCTVMGKAMLAADFREVRSIVGPGGLGNMVSCSAASGRC